MGLIVVYQDDVIAYFDITDGGVTDLGIIS